MGANESSSLSSVLRQRLATDGLYAITDETLCARAGLGPSVEQALSGGARLIQYRDKSKDREKRHAEASDLVRACREAGALSIINDDYELAASVSADGVHLGKDDALLAEARRALGADAVIGVSCYNDLDLAFQAAEQGADYIAFGSFFPSSTKPAAVRADVGLIREFKARHALPVTAIGGITAENAAPLVQAGANHLAIISALFGSTDVAAYARSIGALFEP